MTRSYLSQFFYFLHHLPHFYQHTIIAKHEEEVSVQNLMNPTIAMKQYKKEKIVLQRPPQLAQVDFYYFQDTKTNKKNFYHYVSEGGIFIEQRLGGSNELVLIDINLNQPPSLVEQRLSRYHPSIIKFVNCKINCQLIDQLSKDKKIRQLIFSNCALGNLFFNEKLNNVYINLQSLQLSSDAFGNKGLRILMLNYLPKLRRIIFNNTNLTSDCVKILSKKCQPQYIQIGFTKQQRFRYDQLLKECNFMLGCEKPGVKYIEGDFNKEQQNFIYLNNIAKIKDVPLHKLCISKKGREAKSMAARARVIITAENREQSNIAMLTSAKIQSILKTTILYL